MILLQLFYQKRHSKFYYFLWKKLVLSQNITNYPQSTLFHLRVLDSIINVYYLFYCSIFHEFTHIILSCACDIPHEKDDLFINHWNLLFELVCNVLKNSSVNHYINMLIIPCCHISKNPVGLHLPLQTSRVLCHVEYCIINPSIKYFINEINTGSLG